MKKAILLFICAILFCGPLIIPLQLQATTSVPQAIANAIGFFAEEREPYALLWLDVIHRRFGIEEFADGLQRCDREILRRPEQAAMIRIFRRMADHSSQLQDGDLEEVSAETDRITVPALYCDRMGLPENYVVMLERMARRGRYMLTHVVPAWIWIQENGCRISLPAGFMESIYRDTAAIINEDQVVNDLELEAAAFLCLAGQGAQISRAFVERVIATQNEDGGWLIDSDKPGQSDWHPTIMALVLLLHASHPADSYLPMLDLSSP
jgi:hypothetical protein